MSEIITATDFTDPLLATIRTQVSSKEDKIPYLLLPVKIETRFMKVDSAISGKDRFPGVMEKLIELEDYMHFDPTMIPHHEALGRTKKIIEMLNEIKEESGQIEGLSNKDKELLARKMKSIEKQTKSLTKTLTKSKSADEPATNQLRKVRIQLSATIITTARAIEALHPTPPSHVDSPIETFFESLQSVTDGLEKIATKNLSSSDRKVKREIFAFLDDQFAEAEYRLKTARKNMAVNMTADAAQLRKLDSFSKQVKSLSARIEKNIAKIKSAYKVTEYSERLAGLQRKLELVDDEMQTMVKPKMRMMSELKRIDARDLLTDINETRSYIKKLNNTPFLSNDALESIQKKLFQKLDGLRAAIKKIIEGNDDEFNVIGTAWDDTDKELEKFTTKIKAYKVKNSKGSTIVDRTISKINGEYRNDLAGLKSSTKSSFRRFNNSALEKTVTVYTTYLKRIKEISEKLKEVDSPRAADEHLEEFIKAFKIASSDLYILPKRALTDLKNAAKDLENNLKRVVKKVQPKGAAKSKNELSTRASELAQTITGVLGEQFADAPGVEVGESKRSSLVFATKTITKDELWVRFYPDDIAIHTHEEALTQAEVNDAMAYWNEIWAAEEDQELKLAAWRAISTSYGPQRASWIVKSLEPAKLSDAEIRDRLSATSKSLMTINNDLVKVNELFAKIAGTKNMFEIIAEAAPILKSILEKIKKIERAHGTLLLKTHKLLLSLQSAINKIVVELQRVPEKERLETGSKVEIVKDFINTFNAVIQKFQTIGKITSSEMIRDKSISGLFPEVKVKDTSWTETPHSRVMPDHFVVLTMRDGIYRHIKVSAPLPPDKLIVGIDPLTFDTETFQYDEDGNLIVDEKIKWLTDFNEALKKGMAVSIPLDKEDVEQGFDKIFVLGIKNTTPLKGKELLEDLISNHHYLPEGASFLPIGTQTNNTEEGSSGYRKIEEDAALSFAVERNNELPQTTVTDPDFPTDRERLAEGLGIDVEVLRNLDYSDRTEISESLVMNKALFHATLGNHMEEGLDSLFTLDNINHTKAFFNQFVSARGFLPSLRIGTQPYGILPTTAFSQFSITQDDSLIPQLTKEDFENPADIKDELQTRYDIRLKELLAFLDFLWTGIRNSKVLYSGNTNPDDPQAHFMEMLGLNAISEELFYRYGVNVAARQAVEIVNIAFNSDDAWSPTKVAETFRNTVFSGYYFKSDNFFDEQNEIPSEIDYLNHKFSRISDQFAKARLFAMRHLQDQSQILGERVDNRELSDIVILPTNDNTGTPEEKLEAQAELQNYIDWLVDQNPWDVHAENKFSVVVDTSLSTGMPSKSLLFLLLRHSVLTAYADAILKILEFEGLTDQVTRKKMGTPGHYHQRLAGSFSYVTKWTYLFSQISRLNFVLGFEMNESNPFYVYMNSLSSTSNRYLNRYLSPESPSVFNNYSNHAKHQVFVDELTETRNAIRKLKDIPTLRLDKLLIEHLDLCTYRLDAWRLGMVNKRLKKQRETAGTGIHLGAYGWVEELRKGGERVVATNIPAPLFQTGDEPVFTDADNLGFIHTPSLNHAITAAILRAGFNANKEIAEVDNQMAVNLSSERVRNALHLINGIRGGQDAATMLGYQFERGLHERYLHIPLELDQYIYDFREEFPLSVPVDESLELGDAALNQVVNGMELLEAAQDFIETKGGPPNPGDSLYQSLKSFEAAWWNSIGNANLNSASAAKKDAMLKEIDRMADAFDALGDLCISESVYQIAKGNHIRASAIMDKLAKGDIPNDIEITDTPRTGTVVTHKTGLFLNIVPAIDHALTASGTNSVPIAGTALNAAVTAANAAAAGWTSIFTPRALAEPTLNKWAGEMIGNPAKIKCFVEYTIEETTTLFNVTLANLDVQPLDVLHLFGTGPLDGGAELNARIAAYVRKNVVIPPDFDGTADDLTLNIKYTVRNAAWAATDHSFYEKAGYIQSLRELVTNSAAMAADDLLIPGEEEVPDNEVRNLQVDELLIRVTNLEARLKIVQDAFNSFFTNEIAVADAQDHTFTNEQIDTLRSLLSEAAAFGVPGTVPDTLVSYGNTVGLSLLNAADGALKTINARLAQITTDIEKGKNTALTNEVRANALVEATKKMLGKAFVVLPQFKLRNATDLSAQINLTKARGLLRSASTFAVEEWSHSISRVRQRLAVLDSVQMWAENFEAVLPEKKVLQFPFTLDTNGTATDHWLGIEFPTGYQPTEDKLSLILMNTGAITTSPDAAKSALLIDEWVEIIPNLNETTGITFNYDQPDAKAPNTLLLAVTPKETGHWVWDNLVHTLNDTLEMAKNRAVEPEHLEDTVFGQILPAILTEIVPPQLLPQGGDDSGDAQDNPLGLQVVTDFGVVNDTFEPETEGA